jgi:chemotaxis protein CheC
MDGQQPLPLADLERDALTEIANIAMGRAATSLRHMVDREVLLTVPSLEIVAPERAAQIVAKSQDVKLIAVRQDFKGLFSGRAILIFLEPKSLELVQIVVGRQASPQDILDLEEEALAETGNVILNSWVATLANLLKHNLTMSLPMVVHGDRQKMFEGVDSAAQLVLFLHINFSVSGTTVSGYLALLMDLPSMDALRLLIADHINNL